MISSEFAEKYYIAVHAKGRMDITKDGFRLLTTDFSTRAGAERTTGINARTLRRWGEQWPELDWPKDSTRGDCRGTKQQDEFTVIGETASLTRIVSERITTLEELVRYANIDTTVWDIERWSCNKWEVAAYDREAKSFTVQDLWQVKATLKRSAEKADILAMLDEVLGTITAKAPKIKLHNHKDKAGCLCEIDLFDIHLGKLAWGKETGQNYDLKIARANILNSIAVMVERIKPYKVGRFLIPVGQDYFNSNSSAQTTAKGTPQDEDDRWKKTFRLGWNVITEVIKTLSKIAPVDVLVVPGNHDEDSSYYIGEVLSAYYRNDQNVKVDNSPSPRKYYVYGKNLIGFTHGSEEKIADLPSVMATERSGDFAATKFREWHLGHQHRKKEYNWISIQENRGVTVRMLRALTATDEWHHKKGYVGNQRAGEAYIWHPTEGLIAQLSVNL